MQQQGLSIPTLALAHTKEISAKCKRQLPQNWTRESELISIEFAVLVEEEIHWQLQREYYHDQYLTFHAMWKR